MSAYGKKLDLLFGGVKFGRENTSLEEDDVDVLGLFMELEETEPLDKIVMANNAKNATKEKQHATNNEMVENKMGNECNKENEQNQITGGAGNEVPGNRGDQANESGMIAETGSQAQSTQNANANNTTTTGNQAPSPQNVNINNMNTCTH